MNFDEAALQYTQLKSQFQSGQISQQQFEDAINALRVETTDGATWQIRVADGAWMRWNGFKWELAKTPEAPQPKPIRKKRRGLAGCLFSLLIGGGILVAVVVAVGGVGYFLVTSGNFSLFQIASIFGPGSGEISIANLDEGQLDARLSRLDTAEGSPESIGSIDLQAFEIGGFGAVEAGRYRLEIGATSGGECILQMSRGDVYQFVAVPEGVAIALEGQNVQSSDEVNMATSSLCRR